MQTHIENIWCPECEHQQEAVVEHSWPWDIRIHECENCKHIIMESEWNKVN